MRSLFAAMVVLGLSVLMLARSASAEAPPQLENRPVKPILEMLAKKSGYASQLAVLRFFAEVAGGETLSVPVGSAPEETWTVLDDAERVLNTRDCSSATPEQVKAAGAIMASFGNVLPVTLRAWTLGHQGKKEVAAGMLSEVIDQSMPAKGCPSEHPSDSYHRGARISGALECIRAFAPKRDVTKQVALIKRAEVCARTNPAEG